MQYREKGKRAKGDPYLVAFADHHGWLSGFELSYTEYARKRIERGYAGDGGSVESDVRREAFRSIRSFIRP